MESPWAFAPFYLDMCSVDMVTVTTARVLLNSILIIIIVVRGNSTLMCRGCIVVRCYSILMQNSVNNINRTRKYYGAGYSFSRPIGSQFFCILWCGSYPPITRKQTMRYICLLSSCQPSVYHTKIGGISLSC